MIGPEILTERLALRSLDAPSDEYVAWMNDPKVVRFTEARFSSHSRAGIAAYIDAVNNSPNDVLFGIFESGRHIGNVKIGPIDWHHHHAYIGLIIGFRDRWGKGLAAEAIRAATAHAASIGLRTLVAGVYANNIGSIKTFRKAGYREAGAFPSFRVSGSRRVDEVHLVWP